jgi:hypothetical protein
MAGGSRRRADQRLAELIASGLPVEHAARQAGVSPATAFRRLREPGFRAEVQSLRQTARDRTVGMLSDAGLMSVVVLRQLLGAEDGRLRLRAAATLLAEGRSYAELADFDERLAAVEERLGGEDGAT